jgi:GTP cyclohydrolase I
VVATKISSAEAKLIDAIKDYLSEKGEDINRDVLIDTPDELPKLKMS